MNSGSTKIVHVLVVDDVQMQRFTMKYGMEVVNPAIKIDQAESLAQAIEKLSSNDYSAVISDWSMPGGGGEELVHWMRARPQFNNVAFIMISAKSNNKDIIQAFSEYKVDDYVVKPFRRKALVEKMMAAIEKRRRGTA